MGDKTGIEWTDATWTPLRARNTATGKIGWHCEHKSAACKNCYAESLNLRLGTKLPFKPGHLDNGDVLLFLDEALLSQPLRWQRPRQIFVCSMTDLFADFMVRTWIAKVFAVMALCPQHLFQVLTKRPARMQYLTNHDLFVREVDEAMNELAPAHWCKRELEDYGGWPLKNVMLGGSAGDQDEADEVVISVCGSQAVRHFLSYEPAIGPLDVTAIRIEGRSGVFFDALAGSVWTLVDGERRYVGGVASETSSTKIDWVIAGGESGLKARPPHPDWFRAMRDQCAAAKVPFFFKQWGEWQPAADHDPRVCKHEPAALHVTQGEEHRPLEAFRHLSLREEGWAGMCRVGKKKAGALLDGREHRETPKLGSGA